MRPLSIALGAVLFATACGGARRADTSGHGDRAAAAKVVQVNPFTNDRGAALAVVQSIVGQQCSHCHDADHKLLELETPLALDDKRLPKILNAVATFRMPPSTAEEANDAVTNTLPTKADLEARFPLGSAERARLINFTEFLLSKPPSPTTRVGVSNEARFEVMKTVASQWIPDTKIAELAYPLLASRHSYIESGRTRNEEMAARLKLELIALEICREVARVDPTVAAPDNARLARFYGEIFGVEASETDLAEATSLLAQFQKIGTGSDTPFVALCTTYLTDPKLAFVQLGAINKGAGR